MRAYVCKCLMSNLEKKINKSKKHCIIKCPEVQVHLTLVLAGGRPSSYFLFFLIAFFLPPVLRLLCQESREIPKFQTNIIIKFRYNACSDWLKQRALSEYRCTE